MRLLTVFIALFLGGWLWAEWIEPNWFRLRQETVRLKKPLRKSLTILHLSDLHFVRERFFLKRFFDRLSGLKPDFIFVTGDLIDNATGIEPCVRNLAKLKSKYGTYVVWGNHDHRIYPPFEVLIHLMTGKDFTRPRPAHEKEHLKQSLEKAGFHLLLNRNTSVKLSDGRTVCVIGIDDPITAHANFNEAFQGAKDGALYLALVHAPRAFPALGHRGTDVAFAGHTHGGQLRFPVIGPMPLAYWISPIIDSTERYGFAGVVSRGLGAQPIGRQRLFCRPEAVLVTVQGL